MQKSCPFCTIESEGRTLRTGQYAHVIFSNPRVMPGHLLVIPKRHVQRLSELAPEEREEIIGLTMEFQEKILEKLSTGCDIRQNFKPYVKNSRTHVDHLHIHLLPRDFEDEMFQKIEPHSKPLYRNLPADEKNRLSEMLRGA